MNPKQLIEILAIFDKIGIQTNPKLTAEEKVILKAFNPEVFATKCKTYYPNNIPEINQSPELEFKIAKAIIMSLVKRSLLSQQQGRLCIEQLEVK